MNRLHQCRQRQFHLDSQRGFPQQVGHVRADHCNADDLVRLAIRHDLDKAFCIAARDRLAAGRKRKLANLERGTGLAGLSLRQPDGRDFGRGINRARNHPPGHAPALAGHIGHGAFRFGPGLVGQQQATAGIAHGIDAWHIGAAPVIGLNRACTELDACLFKRQRREARSAPHRHQYEVHRVFLRTRAGGVRHQQSLVLSFDLTHRGTCEELNAASRQAGLQHSRDIRVFFGKQAIELFDHRDLDAKVAEDLRELCAYDATAHNQNAVWQRLE